MGNSIKRFMRGIAYKIIVFFAVSMMLVNSSLLLVVSTAIDEIQKSIDESKINVPAEIVLEKYVNYNIKSGTGVLVQANLKTGIEYGENQEYKPLNSTGVTVNLPKIQEKYPERVEVIGISTKATNGKDNADNYHNDYDSENGVLKIVAVNSEDENGNIYKEKIDGARDEYRLILYYGADCYSNENIKRDLKFTGTVEANIVSEEQVNKKVDFEQNYEVTENISGLISTNVENSEIYNGYINSNKQNETNYRTEYTENLKIQISYKEISDEITVKSENSFINKKDEQLKTDEIIYKSTKVNKNQILDKLGENGYLQILNKNGDILGEVNKDTEADENGTIEITYENELSEMIIKMSKPKSFGDIDIQNIKQIKETMVDTNNNKIQVKNIVSCVNNIKETSTIIDEITKEEKEVINEHTEEIYNYENSNVTEIKEAETKIDLSIDRTEWTNNVQNEVTFTATLLTNGPEYDLFKNPVIDIKLPSEVEKVILGDVALLYNNGLNLKNAVILDKADGKYIRVELDGEQKEYVVNSLINGANVIIPATIILKNDINSKDSNISVTYTNELETTKDYVKEGKEFKELNIKIQSITDEITQLSMQSNNEGTQIENNNSVETSITEGLDIDVKAQVGNKILSDGDTVYERQVIKYTVTAKNTTDKDISEIEIKGQVPDGTTYATLDIGTYYDEKYKYIKDSNVKEYTIPITEVKANETITKFYEVVVEDLENENEKNIQNTVSTKVKGKQYDSKTLNNVIKNAELDVQLISYIGRQYKSQFCYFIYVTNMTNKTLSNVNLETTEFPKEVKYEESSVFVSPMDDDIELQGFELTDKMEDNKYKAIVSSIEPGKTIAVELKVMVGDFEYGINEFDLNMSVTAGNEETKTYISNENRRKAYPEYVTLKQEVLDKNGNSLEGEQVQSGTEITYKLEIKNESKIKTSIKFLDNFDKNLENIVSKYSIFDIKEFCEDTTAFDTIYDIEQEANTQYELKEQEVSNDDKLEFYATIPAGKTLYLTITAVTSEVLEKTEVTNYFTVSGAYIQTRDSNISKFSIVPINDDNDDDFDDNDEPSDPDVPVDPDEPDNPDKPDKPSEPEEPDNPGENEYRNISGLVWIDENNDGIRQNSEQKLKNVIVKLYNANTNTIAVDTNNNKQITETDSNGMYKFSDVEDGKYLILFEYDNNIYKVSKYKSSEADDSVNSDATIKEVSIDGIIKTVAVTDILSVNKVDLENIDLGLIKNQKFDLSLKKYITKITTNNAYGTKEYSFDNKQLAKIEIPAKQINNTNVSIEYKIVVTNEGNVDAYVSEIIDYLPEELNIDSTKEREWIKKSNGEVINTSLSGTKLASGESKEVTLIVNKTLTSDNIGTILNAAEIGKSKNLENLTDVDSKEANKDENEDDYSEATVIISVKTGLVRNIFIILGILLIAVAIIYFVKSKNKKILMFFIVCLMCLNAATVTNAKWWDGILIERAYDYTYTNRRFMQLEMPENIFVCIDVGHHFKVDCIHEYNYDYTEAKSFSYTDTHESSINITKLEANINDNNKKKCEIKFKYDYDKNNIEKYDNIKLSYEISINYTTSDEKSGEYSVNLDTLTNKDGYYVYTYNAEKELKRVNVTLKINVQNGIEYIDWYNQTDVLKCVGGTNCEHVSYDCSDNPNGICVQRMKQTNLVPEYRYEDKSVKKSTSDSEKYGDVKILKVDGDSYDLLGGKVKFCVYYIDEKGNEQYVRTGSGKKVEYSNQEIVLEIDSNGCYVIKGLALDRKYYFREITAHSELYEVLDHDVKLEITNYSKTNLNSAKRGTRYLFTLKDIKQDLKNKYDTDGTAGLSNEEKKKYVTFIYKYIKNDNVDDIDLGVKGTKFTQEQLENKDKKRTEKTRREYLASLISSDPEDDEIKKVINYIFDNYTETDEITNIIKKDPQKETTGMDYYVKKIMKADYLSKNNALKKYQVEKMLGYLRNQRPNLIKNSTKTGSITISKYDEDTGEALSGAVFSIINNNISEDTEVNTIVEIKSNSTEGTIKQVNGDSKSRDLNVKYKKGAVTIKGLPFGTYIIREIQAPDGYNIKLQANTIRENIVLDKKHVDMDVDFTNKKYGNLVITKTDSRETNKKLRGVRFYISTADGYYITGISGTPSEIYKTKTKTEYPVKTDRNGQIRLDNIPVGTYFIEEASLDGDVKYFYEVDSTERSVTVGNNVSGTNMKIDTGITITNEQKYVDISGCVWEDIAGTNKETLRDNLHQTNETPVGEITVTLRKNGAFVAKTTTNANGNYHFLGKVITQDSTQKKENGEIVPVNTKQIEIKDLSGYYIEFEYNGLRYQNVIPGANNWAANSSKASEKSADRTNFNNSYASITGGNNKTTTGTTGYSKDTSGNITNNLTYTNGKYTSSLVQHTGYTSANGKVMAQKGSVGVVMKADTQTANYSIQWTPGTYVIGNVNLGLYEREQPDIAIASDLDSIGLEINGYNHTYSYNQRLKAAGIDIFSEINKWQNTPSNYPTTYTRSIYKNYAYASAVEGNGKIDNKLQVYLTYKIVVKNESSSKYISANEIANYCDKSLDLNSLESWYENANGVKTKVDWASNGEKNGYNQIRTTSLKDIKIEHGQSITIYLKMKKKDENVLAWATKNELEEETYNVSEITSYSTYEAGPNNTYVYYAGIDKDSAPDNIIPGEVSTYEDDTDSAPVLKITFDEPRTISGYVFEDATKSELNTGKERKGDGKYDASTDGYVEKVKVELLKDNDEKAYIYPNAVSENKFNATEAVYTTTADEKGYYEFVGIIPGKYYLKFTYGDGSVIYKTTGEKVNVTTQDYKSTIITSDVIKNAIGTNYNYSANTQWYQRGNEIAGYSSAIDDYDTRKNINEKLTNITYGVKSGYESKQGEYASLQMMTARTPGIDIAIENKNGETTTGDENRTRAYENIDFGIVERPRQSVETTKEISHIKLKLANGQVLVEGDPRTDNMNYVTYPQGGSLKIEVDNEIIEGATLDVTYEIQIANKSELDYNTKDYYYYGNNRGQKPVDMKINSLIDHMDEDLKTTYTFDGANGEWKLVEKISSLRDKGLISQDVYNSIKSNHNVLLNNCDLTLKPGKSIKLMTVSASKLLSTSKEMLYENYAEVLTASNDVGRFYGQKAEDTGNKWKVITPGNFNPKDPETTSEEDNNTNNRSKLSIIPPTGSNKDVVIYGVIGTTCLLILFGGIVLIKKKVLD